jgi:hypothetical protein
MSLYLDRGVFGWVCIPQNWYPYKNRQHKSTKERRCEDTTRRLAVFSQEGAHQKSTQQHFDLELLLLTCEKINFFLFLEGDTTRG